MGRALLILLTSLSVSFTIFSVSRNQRIVEAADELANRYESYSAVNAAASGAWMALSRLYQDDTWRAGYQNLVLNGDTINVMLSDATTDPLIPDNQIRIQATGRRLNYTETIDVMVFNGRFNGYAVWSKDSVLYVTTLDSAGLVSPDLLMQEAPFMPEIDDQALENEAIDQGHFVTMPPDSFFDPMDGYPNGSFYYSGQTPNVIVVDGDMRVKNGRTIYGIYLVRGDVRFDSNATLEGIIYLPQSDKIIYNSNAHVSYVNGGILSWGKILGAFGDIEVKLVPDYMGKFVNNFVPRNPPLRVLSWKK